MKHWFDCPVCGDEFHVDDDDLKYCDVCDCHVCSQCIKIVDDKVVSCENCENISLRKTVKIIQEAKLESLIERIKSLEKLCLQKHKRDVKYTLDNIIKNINCLIDHKCLL